MYNKGTRLQVMRGTAKYTTGGLSKKDLKYNKYGKIVSKNKSNLYRKLYIGGENEPSSTRATSVSELRKQVAKTAIGVTSNGVRLTNEASKTGTNIAISGLQITSTVAETANKSIKEMQPGIVNTTGHLSTTASHVASIAASTTGTVAEGFNAIHKSTALSKEKHLEQKKDKIAQQIERAKKLQEAQTQIASEQI